MPRTSTFPEADKAAGGTLAAELCGRREAGDSFATIARWLLTDLHFTVSTETLRRWCMDLDIEKVGPEAKAAS